MFTVFEYDMRAEAIPTSVINAVAELSTARCNISLTITRWSSVVLHFVPIKQPHNNDMTTSVRETIWKNVNRTQRRKYRRMIPENIRVVHLNVDAQPQYAVSNLWDYQF